MTEANKRGIFSVGIGDHGNELGFGTIWEAVAKTIRWQALMMNGEWDAEALNEVAEAGRKNFLVLG